MTFLTREQLEKLTTQRLYAYKKSLMRAVDGPDWDEDNDNGFHRKNPDWVRTYGAVKEVLGAREHIERKQ